jgi:cyclase
MPDQERYTTGLHRVADHVYAYMQPDGSWGLNNLGVVIGKGRSLLIDAATDIPRTRAVLAALQQAEPGSAHVDTVLFTHWHLDHVWGASLFPAEQRIVATKTVAQYLRDYPTQALLQYLLDQKGDAKKLIDLFMGDKFDFRGLKAVYASEEFERQLDLDIDGVRVDVRETQPSHTLSDSVVFMPQEGVVHLGDLLSAGRHWILQYPSSANLIATCDLLISFRADVYIPGHGPLLDVEDIRSFRDYVLFIREQVRGCYDRGMEVDPAFEYVVNNLGPYRALDGPARLFHTTKMLYCEFDGRTDVYSRVESPERFAESWQLMKSIPQRFPELAKARAHVIDAVRGLRPD